MKDRMNLSRWALEHIPFIRYLMVVLLLGGVIGYGKLGQDDVLGGSEFRQQMMELIDKADGGAADSGARLIRKRTGGLAGNKNLATVGLFQQTREMQQG